MSLRVIKVQEGSDVKESLERAYKAAKELYGLL
jgi:hypothetical protein